MTTQRQRIHNLSPSLYPPIQIIPLTNVACAAILASSPNFSSAKSANSYLNTCTATICIQKPNLTKSVIGASSSEMTPNRSPKIHPINPNPITTTAKIKPIARSIGPTMITTT
ncbi:hypothetical protein LINGRAHAP2_LOCUS2738 [Linum grandiflorum]